MSSPLISTSSPSTARSNHVTTSTTSPGQESAGLKAESITSSTGKSSSRRLSSLTGLHHLHPFTSAKRRSLQGLAELKQAITPNVMIESPTMQHVKRESKPRMFSKEDKASRRSSWLPLPENPSKPLPRSLTFGNLTRSRAPAQAADTDETAPPKVPTATINRPSLRSRIPSVPKELLKIARQRHLPRPYTQPLLARDPVPLEPTHTRFLPKKENNPPLARQAPLYRASGDILKDKPLPLCPDRRSISTTTSPTDRDLLRPVANLSIGQPSTVQQRARLINIPGRTLPRWNTQPNLGSALATKTEVQHHSLLNPSQVPAPPPQRSPLQPLTNTSRPSTAPRPRPIYEKDFNLFTTPPPISNRRSISTPSPTPDTEVVSTLEPTAYWSGRFVSQLDRHRTLAFQETCTSDHLVPETIDDRQSRVRLVFGNLYASCEGDEAKSSLQQFHAQLRLRRARMSVKEEEDIVGKLGWSDVVAVGEEVRAQTGRETMGEISVVGDEDEPKVTSTPDRVERLSAVRRGTFMERLLGRGKKISN